MISYRKQRVFVISDTHFHHKNIIAYTNRPFSSVEEMDAALICNWNRVVSPQDIVVHCGDFALGFPRKNAQQELLKINNSLNGYKILILGNHDYKKPVDFYKAAGFSWSTRSPWLIGDKIAFCHYREQVKPEDRAGRFIYCGHLHNDDPEPETASWKDVCVEWINYTPIDITDKLTDFEYNEIISKVFN